MARIVHFKSKKQKASEWLQDLFSQKIEKAKSIAVIMDMEDEVVTAYLNADLMQKLNLKQHFEFDILDQFMARNMDRYLEYVKRTLTIDDDIIVTGFERPDTAISLNLGLRNRKGHLTVYGPFEFPGRFAHPVNIVFRQTQPGGRSGDFRTLRSVSATLPRIMHGVFDPCLGIIMFHDVDLTGLGPGGGIFINGHQPDSRPRTVACRGKTSPHGHFAITEGIENQPARFHGLQAHAKRSIRSRLSVFGRRHSLQGEHAIDRHVALQRNLSHEFLPVGILVGRAYGPFGRINRRFGKILEETCFQSLLPGSDKRGNIRGLLAASHSREENSQTQDIDHSFHLRVVFLLGSPIVRDSPRTIGIPGSTSPDSEPVCDF